MTQILKNRNHQTANQKIHYLASKVATCTYCEELVKTRNQSVMGYGDFKADIFIIGEAPGRLGANVTGVPFTKDRSGVFLQKMLCKIGLNESDPECIQPKLKGVYITNIVKCNPQTENGTNRSPKNEEISNCMNYLENELEIVKPKIVISLGLPASKLILGNDFNGKNFGKIIKKQRFSVLPLWHPAFVIRGGGAQRMNEKRYSSYFKKIRKFLKNT